MKSMNSKWVVLIATAFLLHACASSPPVTPDNAGDYLARARTQVENGITVKAGVPDREESKALFKTDLYKYGVQPVWLVITNSSEKKVSVLPAGLDPGYFHQRAATGPEIVPGASHNSWTG